MNNPLINVDSALEALGIDDPGQDLLDAIQCLTEMVHDNLRHRKEGRDHLVNEDYGPDLNELAERLAVPFVDNTAYTQ
jgi:hypothetical protein